MNAKLSNLHTESCFPWLYVSVVCALAFSAHIFFFCMLMLFFLSLLFPHSALAFPNVAVKVSCNSARAQASSLVHYFLIDSSTSSNQSKRGGNVS